jgi:hypothetical protein
VTALYAGAGNEGVATATVTLSGAGLPEAVWEVKRVRDRHLQHGWGLTATGDAGRVEVTCDSGRNYQARGHRVFDSDFEQVDRGTVVLERFKRALEAPAESRDWSEIVRDMEIVEATHRSVRRRRTIDLHFESTSERSLFKTAIGCGVLTFTLLAVVALLVATPLLDLRDRQQVESERARAVFTEADFEPGTAALSNPGRERLEEIADRMSADRFNILIEKIDGSEALVEARRKSVAEGLVQHGAADAEGRTVVAEIRGRWLAGVLRIARIAVFVPLFLFLGLQLLLFLTRPPAN